MTKWEQLQEKLQVALSKEIALRQELLGNMRQQEHLLLVGDLVLKEELQEMAHSLINHLKKMTQFRLSLTQQLIQRLYSNGAGMRLNEILNPLVEIEAQTLMLYQKTKSLIHQIHGQHLRNKTLQKMIDKEGPLQIRNGSLLSEMIETKEAKKTSLITIDYNPNERSI